MGYVTPRQRSRRAAAIGGVAAVHLVIGYGFVTGLAPDWVPPVETIFTGIHVPADPPPPPAVEPEPADDPVATPATPILAAPPPKVRTPVTDSVPLPLPPRDPVAPTQIPFDGPRDFPTAPTPPRPLPTPRAEPARLATAPTLRDIGFGDADYPDAAIRAGEAGVTRVRVAVGTDGRATSCAVSRSSGSSALDQAACRLVRSRSRFTPATDTGGAKVARTLDLPVTWRLPG